MHVLCIDCAYAPALRQLGHTVTVISPPPGVTELAVLLENLPAPPDCLIQQEHLGERRILAGLETAPCPTVFIAVDVHLNMFWHRHYARLFDAVATPHLSWFQNLPPEWRHPQVLFLPHTGQNRPWKPHAGRQHDLALVARMTEHRQLRRWMVDLLRAEHGLLPRDNLSFAAMLDLYGDTRCIPNESICFEVNFRLFEGASCGAAVLTPDIGPDQDAVFAPGTEMIVYRDGLELVELVSWLKKHPDAAERVGRAAWERVQRDHLPEHRAKALADGIPGLRRDRVEGGAAAAAFWLVRLELTRNGVLRLPIPALLAQAEALPQTPDVLAGRLRLLAESGRRAELTALCRAVLTENMRPSSLDCNAAASAAALRQGDFHLARQFWNSYLLHCPGAQAAPAAPATPFDLCLAWADALRRAGRSARIGSPFAPETGHLPLCAFEFLGLARFLDAKNPESSRRLDVLTAAIPAYTALRLGVLAELALHDQDNWRLQFAYGVLSLQACRVQEGLFEIAEAEKKAETAGKRPVFSRMLAALPSGGYIAAKMRPFPHA